MAAVAISTDEFLKWAHGVGVGFDPRYTNTNWLRLLPPRESSRFWVLPDHPCAIPHLIGAILDGLDEWKAGYLWPRAGRWPPFTDAFLHESVRDIIWRSAGMPDAWTGAAHVACDEVHGVIAALFASVALGGDSLSDLYFVPEHGRQIVWAGHHDAIHVECADDFRIEQLVRHMEKAKFLLPTEPPDATFRWPAWMPPGPVESGTAADER